MSWFGKLNRTTLALGSLIMAGIILVSVNLIASTALRHVKADLTEQRLFTISDGTRDVLKSIDEPIQIRVYYSKPLGEAVPSYRKYFDRVRALLTQYRDISDGKLEISFLDPEPFSDAEDRAVAAGLNGVRINREGDQGYFGLVATNSTDNVENIGFFNPQRERYLEYDLTKLVHKLANPKKRVVGLISSLPIEGGMSQHRQPTPAWTLTEQIRDFFELRNLGLEIAEIPKDVDVVMVVQPDGIAKETVYAIDQYALGGGQVLVFVDPVSEIGRPGPPGMAGADKEGPFHKLLKAWGLTFSADKVAGDVTHARRVQLGGGPRPVMTDYVSWLALGAGNLNEGDVLSAGIEQLNVASAGILETVEGAKTTVSPLISTSTQSMAIEASKLQFNPDAVALLRSFQAGGKPLMLAARVTGEAESAFPDGDPKAAAKTDEAKSTNEAKPEEKAARPEPEAEAKPAHRKSGRINAVVIADSDMLHDQFWVSVQDFFGQRMMIPNAHNAAFVVNALENLSGGSALAALRGRGVDDRPFQRVNDIRRDAERRFREKEQALLAKLKDVQAQLSQIESKGDSANAILSDKDKRAIEQFRSEMISVRRELRGVKHALRKDIDRLDGTLKFANIAGIPLIIGFGGLAVAFASRRRRRARR